MCGKQKILLQEDFERQVHSEPILSMLHHMCGLRLDLEKTVLHHRLDRDTLPNGVKLAPACYAVDIHLYFGAGQLVELIPGPALFLLHQSPDPKIPGGGVEVRHGSIVEDG